MMQHPKVHKFWLETMNPFSESFKDLTIVLLINCLSLRHKILMNNTLTVEKQNSMDFIFNLLIPAFLGHGELLVCHSELWRLVSGSYLKIHNLSPVMMFEKTFVIFNAFKKVQAHIPSIFLLFVGEVFWNQLRKNFLPAQFLG